MIRQLITLMIVVLSLLSVSALAVNVSDIVYVNANEIYFIAEVVNESSSGQALSVSYFAPVPTQVLAPAYIAPNAKTTVKIFIKNEMIIPVDISTKLEVQTDKYISKEILLKFNQEKVSENNTGSNGSGNTDTNVSNNIGGMFTLSIAQGATFLSTESVLVFLLILVVLVLLIAFIVRLAKRV